MTTDPDNTQTPTDAPAPAAAPAPESAVSADVTPAAPAVPAEPNRAQSGFGGGGGGGGFGGGGGGGGGRRGGGGGGRGGPRRGGGGQRGGGGNNRDEGGVESSLVKIYRCAKVVKGGRTFSFAALVIAGDRAGSVGIGYGKANEVPMAVEKATKDARRTMIKVPLKGSTIPHTITGKHGASSVTLVPALPGSGVSAGKSVRPCLELAGITDILTKAYGSTSPKNLVKATIDALSRLKSRDDVERDRGVKLEAVAGKKELATA